jgi:hypothetical protein
MQIIKPNLQFDVTLSNLCFIAITCFQNQPAVAADRIYGKSCDFAIFLFITSTGLFHQTKPAVAL